ncbi:MFS transporter [Paraburkholderia susongensis]|uniref:MFS transporter, AAHS family, 4-hydroxybenzoate transporter n=1 Tax=Paraburkholderia susongensis TaxID=1515439 RepID=A0A1X7M767_9BURK|nr:MFS transporter [Paraburkholderia susongensis]SMG61353.1 MFS transporter, AAHS family, 4-hydroxybenzoate transporter [Paraburkholderia susongensis]
MEPSIKAPRPDTSAARAIDVQQWFDERPVGRFQILVLLMCMFIVTLDGLDTVMVGFIAPALSSAWAIPRDALGPVMSGGLLGLAFGALCAGPLADRLGRKTVMTCAVLFFGVWSLGSAFATGIGELTVLRFLTGLGLGASMPNAATLMAEYAPQRCRALMVTTVFCGFTLGAAGGGFVSAWLIASHGWRSVLILGGVLPILYVPLMIRFLPESARFLALKDTRRARLVTVMNRIERGIADRTTRFAVHSTAHETRRERSPVRLILSRDYAFGTVMLWVCYFAGLLTVYLLGSWLPTLIRGAGFTLAEAALVGALFQAGGTIGSLAIGWLMDRFNPHRALGATVFAGGVLAWAMGLPGHGIAMIAVLAFFMGYCMNGSNTGFCALAAGSYPTRMRATGTSWMLGIGRFGGIAGAMLGAGMLHANWGFSEVFTSLALPAAVGAAAVLLKGARHRGPLLRVSAGVGH